VTIPKESIRLVLERSGGVCERCLVRPASQIHHRCARQAGGSKHTSWINLASNLAHLCGSSADGCHGWATSFPALARDHGWVVLRAIAERLGGSGPIPVEDLFGRSWWLHPDGRRIRFTHLSTPAGLGGPESDALIRSWREQGLNP
jgi:hypothetical protein